VDEEEVIPIRDVELGEGQGDPGPGTDKDQGAVVRNAGEALVVVVVVGIRIVGNKPHNHE
jgi:hypothetical protein